MGDGQNQNWDPGPQGPRFDVRQSQREQQAREQLQQCLNGPPVNDVQAQQPPEIDLGQIVNNLGINAIGETNSLFHELEAYNIDNEEFNPNELPAVLDELVESFEPDQPNDNAAIYNSPGRAPASPINVCQDSPEVVAENMSQPTSPDNMSGGTPASPMNASQGSPEPVDENMSQPNSPGNLSGGEPASSLSGSGSEPDDNPDYINNPVEDGKKHKLKVNDKNWKIYWMKYIAKRQIRVGAYHENFINLHF